MDLDLDAHLTTAEAAVADAVDLDALAVVDTELLGRKSVLATVRSRLADMDPDDRKVVGRRVNEVRTEVERLISERRAELAVGARAEVLEAERLDLTEFDRGRRLGHRHVVTQTWERLEDLFVGMGYTVAEGPEIEDEWHNFGALNFPLGHPARDMYDTLYVEYGEPQSTMLRTHTSPVQIRVMEEQEPPIYSIMPGRVFRSDTADATHNPTFHQIEGLYVDRNVTMADLKGTVEFVFRELLGKEVKLRFRPHYFSYTEPSLEIDFSSPLVRKMGKEWLEIAGCGMVHPTVFENVGYDPEEWSGWAFGFGIERIAMIRYGISDIRLFYENDLRFLNQF